MVAKKLLLLWVLVFACGFPVTCRAQGGPGFPTGSSTPSAGPVLPPPFMMALRVVDLTPEQQNKMNQIMASGREQSEEPMKELRSIHEQIANMLLGTGPVSEADLAPFAQRAGRIDQQMQEQWVSTALRVRALLTPEQLTKMNQFHQQVVAINAQIEKLMQGPMPRVVPKR